MFSLLLVALYSLFITSYFSPNTCHFFLIISYFLLVTHITRYFLPVIFYFLTVTRYFLLAIRYFSHVTHRELPLGSLTSFTSKN